MHNFVNVLETAELNKGYSIEYGLNCILYVYYVLIKQTIEWLILKTIQFYLLEQ